MEFTPKQIVKELDKYIIGQDEAKKQVAISLRNRYRRSKLSQDIQNEITPKNIIMKGPTGVGKTEIARRLAKIISAPFVKVEATKFTEVGYVGKDVESMIKDLVSNSYNIVKQEFINKNKQKALNEVNKLIVKVYMSQHKDDEEYKDCKENIKEIIEKQLKEGKIDNKIIEVEVPKKEHKQQILSAVGMEDIDLGALFQIGGNRPRYIKKKLKVKEALDILVEEKSNEMIDEDEIIKETIYRAENHGIIFIDEIDKIAIKSERGSGPSVSREGVQRDILPIVEGSIVNTKYGTVKTDYMLFIAAGAFHESAPTDLIPELQGRFPVTVDLLPLTKEDFIKILKCDKNGLLKQYTLLLGVDNVDLKFTEEAIEIIATIAFEDNEEHDNIGARRLHSVIEKLLFDISFNAGDLDQNIEVLIDAKYVEKVFKNKRKSKDLNKYIL